LFQKLNWIWIQFWELLVTFWHDFSASHAYFHQCTHHQQLVLAIIDTLFKFEKLGPNEKCLTFWHLTSGVIRRDAPAEFQITKFHLLFRNVLHNLGQTSRPPIATFFESTAEVSEVQKRTGREGFLNEHLTRPLITALDCNFLTSFNISTSWKNSCHKIWRDLKSKHIYCLKKIQSLPYGWDH
jgi:hypothetical protein